MIRVGLCGFGYWGANLARNLNETPGLQLTAIADVSQERRDLAHQRFPLAVVVASSGEVAGGDLCDAVVVATPVALHDDIAGCALMHGKDVLVEKPLADSVENAERLAALAEEADRVLMVDHTFVYTGAVQKMRSLYETSALGRMLHADSVRVNLGLFQPDVDVVWDLAPHDVSIFTLLFGPPTAVRCVGSDPLGRGKVSSAYLLLDYSGIQNFVAGIHVSWLSPVKVRRMMLSGDRRMVVYDDIEPTEKVRVYDAGADVDELTRRVDYRTGDVVAPKLEFDEALAAMCRHFAQSIESHREPLTGAHAGVSVVRVLDAASRSMAAGGSAVAL